MDAGRCGLLCGLLGRGLNVVLVALGRNHEAVIGHHDRAHERVLRGAGGGGECGVVALFRAVARLVLP